MHLVPSQPHYVVRADAELLGKGLGSLPLSAEQQARLLELAGQAQSITQQPGQVCSLPVPWTASAWIPRPHLCLLHALGRMACRSLAAAASALAVCEGLHLQ